MVERTSELAKVKFGNTAMMVTEVCAGTMTWGSFNDKPEQAYAQLDKIVEMGVNFIDNAELYPVAFNYGKTTEEWLGNWLESRVNDGKVKREALYIATKCNPMGIGSPLENKPHGFDETNLVASCEASIERMKCKYIDLYQLHWPTRDVPLFGCNSYAKDGENRPMPFNDNGAPEVFEAQVKAVKVLLDKGLIKYWGLSNENAYGITMFCMTCDKLGVPRPVSCQNDFSMMDRMYEGDTLEAAHRFGVVGLPYGALAGGVLTGKYFDGSKYATMDPDRPLAQRPCAKWRSASMRSKSSCPRKSWMKLTPSTRSSVTPRTT
jgi:aryl-alcohol dehydrogenase-like predicted oxidoreductase